jgi:hypothetical protein
MKRLSVIAVLVATATTASPASAAPSVSSLAKRVNKIVSQLSRIETRLTATVALATTPPTTRNTIVSGPMLQEAPGSLYYRGLVTCPSGTTLTGGGANPGVGGAPRIVTSAPSVGGSQWEVWCLRLGPVRPYTRSASPWAEETGWALPGDLDWDGGEK